MSVTIAATIVFKHTQHHSVMCSLIATAKLFCKVCLILYTLCIKPRTYIAIELYMQVVRWFGCVVVVLMCVCSKWLKLLAKSRCDNVWTVMVCQHRTEKPLNFLLSFFMTFRECHVCLRGSSYQSF